MKLSDNRQKAIIHAAKSQLNLSEDSYRELLSGFGVKSSKDLTTFQADKLISDLVSMGYVQRSKSQNRGKKNGRGWGNKKFSYLQNRDPEFATPKQLRMLDGMWHEVSRLKTDSSFDHFIKRIAKVDSIEWISKKHVQQLRAALQDLKNKIPKPEKS